MRLALSLVVMIGLAAGPAWAQGPLMRLEAAGGSDTLASGTDSFVAAVGGMASLRVQTLDSYSGTWEVQCSVDGGVTYDADDEVNLTLEGASSSPVQSVTDTVGIWTAGIAGCTHIKFIATAGFAASDTTIAWRAIQSGGSSGGGGGGASFDGVLLDAAAGDPVTDTVNDALRVNVVAGGAAGNGTSLADDADFTAGTTAGTPAFGFYQSSVTACTDGDTCAAGITSARALKVALENAAGTAAFGTAGTAATPVLTVQGIASMTPLDVSGTVTANLSATDNQVLDDISSHASRLSTSGVSYTGGATSATTALGVGGQYNSTPITLTDTQSSALQLDENGYLSVNIRAGAGSGGTAIADDADFSAGTTSFTPVGGFYQSTPTACTDGDACTAGITSARAVKVALENASGTTAFGTAGTASAAVLTVQGVASMTPITVDAAALDAIQTAVELLDNAVSGSGFNISQIGGSAPAALDPCESGTKTQFVVNINTATTTEIANAVSGEFFYICSINLVAAGAQTVAIVEDDTDGVGSPTAGLNGGTTAATGWSFAANGGIALGTGHSWIMKTTTANRYLGIITGQAAQISGTIVYVSAP